MLVGKQNELMNDFLFTVHQQWRRWRNVKTTYNDILCPGSRKINMRNTIDAGKHLQLGILLQFDTNKVNWPP